MKIVFNYSFIKNDLLLFIISSIIILLIIIGLILTGVKVIRKNANKWDTLLYS